MASLTLTIDRSSLSLADLVISGSGATATNGFVVEALNRPDFQPRYSYAPPSAFVPGQQLLAAVADQASLPVSIHVLADSSAEKATLEAELEAALWQFAYTVTLTVDGASTSWAADPCIPAWGELLHGEVAQFASRASVVIPVNPPGA